MSMLGGLESPSTPRGMLGGGLPVSEYKLTWNNYSVSVASFIRLISPQEGIDSLSDVTVTCTGGKFYKAHRLVLATCSTYFRNIFFNPEKGMTMEQNGCFGYPIVVIPDVQSHVLELILAFMYKGEITVPSHLILPLMEAASVLGVQGLTEPLNQQQQTQTGPKIPVSGLCTERPETAVDSQQHKPLQATSLESQISQAFSQSLLRESVTQQQEETKKRVLTEYVGQEPEDLSKNNRKSIKTDEDNFVTHSESISPPIQESDNKGRCAQDKRYSLHHPLFPPRSIIHNRRKSSPTRCIKSGEWPGLLDQTKPLQLSKTLPFEDESNKRTPTPPLQLLPGSPMTANGHTTPTLTTPETTAATLAAVAAAANTMAALASSTAVYPKTEDPSRPFACGVCPKRFRMKHHLKEHSLIHSGEMPYSCHLCPKRFNRSYTLKNHMKLHNSLLSHNNQEQTTALPLTKRSNSS